MLTPFGFSLQVHTKEPPDKEWLERLILNPEAPSATESRPDR